MVREQAFDVAEMAIVTYLMARSFDKPMVLLPSVVVARHQYAHAVYRADLGNLTPRDLAGRRVGIRSVTTTTGACCAASSPIAFESITAFQLAVALKM